MHRADNPDARSGLTAAGASRVASKLFRTRKSVNFIRKSQKIAAAEGIVFRDFRCDAMPPKLMRGMHRSFRMVLEAGGNEYDAAVGFVLGMTLEQLEGMRPGLFLPDQAFARVCSIVNLAERLLQETLLLRAARDTGSVFAEIRLLAARRPVQ
jgi:hypothetical protein